MSTSCGVLLTREPSWIAFSIVSIPSWLAFSTSVLAWIAFSTSVLDRIAFNIVSISIHRKDQRRAPPFAGFAFKDPVFKVTSLAVAALLIAPFHA